jgi:hypothetical protein
MVKTGYSSSLTVVFAVHQQVPEQPALLCFIAIQGDRTTARGPFFCHSFLVFSFYSMREENVAITRNSSP